jgi:hypothetical protein
VDDLLYRQGVKFCRFVDDFRIFSDSRQELMQVAQLLSEYLYDQHRLHLSSNKTSLLATEKFLEREFFNHYRIEVEEAFVVLGEIEYGGVASVVEFEDGADTGIPFGVLVAKKELSDTEALKEIAARLKETATKTNRVDLNLLRAFLRRCRLANSDAFRPLLESNIEIFLPVFHDLTKALRQLYSVGHQHFVVDFIRKIYESDLISLKFIRYWSDWLASQDADLLAKSGASGAIRANGNLRHQANAAVVSNDLAWVRGFRANVDQLGDWDRRAIVGAARILGKVERRVFLNSVRKRFSGQIVDKLLVDYVSAL